MADAYETVPEDSEEEGGSDFSMAACCAAMVGCFCCGVGVALIVVLLAMGQTGLIILGSAIGIFIVVFIGIFLIHQITINGHTFHLFNYYLPMFKYGLISQFKEEKGVREMWRSMCSKSKPYVAKGMGPVTETLIGWQETAEMLSSWGAMIANGTMMHANELGLAILGPGPFPETQEILPTKNEDHGFVRPILGSAADGSRVPEGQPCDGSNGWNLAWLRSQWAARFDSIDEFHTSDTFWFHTILLHKVLLNMDMTDDEAREFVSFPSGFEFPGTGKVGVGMANLTYRECCLFKYITPLPCFQCKVQEQAELCKEAIQKKFPNVAWDDEKLALTANFFMTGFLYAGGLSVPTVLMNMLAWWYTDEEDRPPELANVRADDEASIRNFAWEAMRVNPPVAGVPRWVKDGDTWRHEVANLEQSMMDERVFPDPMKFKMGRPGLNAQDTSRSLLFSDLAIVNNDTCNPDSHLCPGKNLAVEEIVAFWQEFLKRQWEPDTDEIKVGYNLTTNFTLTKI